MTKHLLNEHIFILKKMMRHEGPFMDEFAQSSEEKEKLLEKIIKELKLNIEEQQNILNQRYEIIQEQQKILDQRYEIIQEQQKILDQREELIRELTKTIAERKTSDK